MDKATQNQLNRGARMVELLKQGQYQPLPVERQILTIFAGMAGFVDAFPVGVLGRWERELYAFLEARRPDVLPTVRAKSTDKKALKFNRTTNEFTGELADLMKSALLEFNKEFVVEQAAKA
jgi:F-type H+-transporting ATPase subunit alpha